MVNSDKHSPTLVDYLILALSLIAGLVSILGATAVYVSQARESASPLWPLPGLVLLLWALIGLIGSLAIYLTVKGSSIKWQRSTWFISGMFIPLIVLGAFSIGPLVFIGFSLFTFSTVLLAFRRRTQWLISIGLFVLGAALNLVLLLVVILLGNPGF